MIKLYTHTQNYNKLLIKTLFDYFLIIYYKTYLMINYVFKSALSS